MKRIVALALSTVIAGPALADGPSVAVITPPVIAPPAPAADWTGPYIGLAIGKGQLGGDTGNVLETDDDIDFNTYGLFGGYNYDMGRAVVGGELSYDKINVDDFDDVDASVLRVMARVGYDAGNFMPYATAGFARAEVEEVSENGYAYGVGVDALFGNNFVVGAQYLRHQFDDVDDIEDANLNANLFQIRAAYKF